MLCQRLKYRFKINNFEFEVTKNQTLAQPPIVENVQPNLKTFPLQPISVATPCFTAIPMPTPPVTTIMKKDVQITNGFVSKLAGRTQIDWEPFICKIEKRIYNKITKRWYLLVNDLEKSHRVMIASQCFYLFEKDIIKKDDIIYVEHYTSTRLASNKPKIIIFTKFYKLETTPST